MVPKKSLQPTDLFFHRRHRLVCTQKQENQESPSKLIRSLHQLRKEKNNLKWLVPLNSVVGYRGEIVCFLRAPGNGDNSESKKNESEKRQHNNPTKDQCGIRRFSRPHSRMPPFNCHCYSIQENPTMKSAKSWIFEDLIKNFDQLMRLGITALAVFWGRKETVGFKILTNERQLFIYFR